MNTVQDAVILTVRQNGLPDSLAAYILAAIEISGGNRHMPALDGTKFIAIMQRLLREELDEPETTLVPLPLNSPRTG